MAQPLLFVIEDLHWSDETSLNLLTSLVRSTVQLPMRYVLTYRSDEVSPELRRFLSECDRARIAREVPLRRLIRSEVESMVRAILGPRQISRSALGEHLYGLTDGNPFFIEEVLKSLMATGGIATLSPARDDPMALRTKMRHPEIPRSIQDAVYQRTWRLSPLAKRALTLAAVAGRHFDLLILQQLMEMEESDLIVCMKELVAAQLITEEAANQFAFRHALTREAVYGELLASERRGLHRTIAESRESRIEPTSILDEQLMDLAYHFYEAGSWLKAAMYGVRAGERCLGLYAPRAAIEHLTRALDAYAQMSALAPSGVLRARGQALETIGAFDEARADYEKALTSASEEQNGLMEWQSLLNLGFLWAGRDYAQAGEWFQRALHRAQELDDAKLQAHSLNRLGNWLVNTGRVQDGLQAHQEALAIFTSCADQPGMAETFDLLGMANGIYGDTVQAVGRFDQAIALLRMMDDRQRLISSVATRIAFASPTWTETTYSVCEPPDRCGHNSAEALDLARQMDSLTAQAYAELNAGLVFASLGDLGDGLAHAQESLRIACEISHEQWQAAAYCAVGHAYLELLEANLAAQSLDAGLALARALGSAWWIGNISAYLAQAYLLQGNLARAEATLQAIMLQGQQPENSPERRICWIWGELALARGDPALALNIAKRLLISIPGATMVQAVPRLLKLKGDALGGLARHEEAITVLEEARHGALARHERPLLWRIDYALGRQYRRLKREDMVQRHFASARESVASLADSIGDPSLRERFIRAALSGLPREKPASSTSSVGKQAYGGLTAREREVARQVALGKSNGEIAETLVVTKRTIETHLNNILYKLNLTSRAQLVVWTIENGLASRADNA
jgi:DNA-binding CsgD family transcriptional regulator